MRATIERLVFICVAVIAGALLGLSCLAGPILVYFHGYDHGFGERARSDIYGAIAGAVVGAVLAWRFLDRRSPLIR